MKLQPQWVAVAALTLAFSSAGWAAEAGQRRRPDGDSREGQGRAVERGRSRSDSAPPRADGQGRVAQTPERDRGDRAVRRRDDGREQRPAPGVDRRDRRDSRSDRGDGGRRDRRDDRWDRQADRRTDRWNRGSYAYRSPRVIVPRRVAPRRYYGPGGRLSVYHGWGSGYRFGNWYTGRVYGYVAPYSAYGVGRYYGDVRLHVRPRFAEVYVDGYYAGIVDDFDGVFQRLTLEVGRHEIEVVAPGYEPRSYEIFVDPRRTVDLHGDLYPGGPY